MNIGSATSSSPAASMAMALQQLKAVTEAQMEVMKMLAESQAQMTQLLQSEGIGLKLNTSA